MIRGALVLCAGFLAYAANANAGCDIATKIAELAPGFSPVNFGNCAPGLDCSFHGPMEFIAKAASPSHARDVAAITAAYSAAPAFFQDALCQLDHIYIDTDTQDPAKPSVWGMRERLHIDAATNKPAAHIAISKRLLTYLESQRAPYAAYEDQLTRALLASAPNVTPPASPIALSYAAAPDRAARNPAAIAVLAILAHEMGHIVWWERDVGNSAFPEISWTTKSVQHGFHNFGVEDPNNPALHHPVKADVQYDLRYLPPERAASDLQKIYGGEWASLFATVAADEDFVETYKLIVLTDTSASTPTRQALTSLKVMIARDGAADILANLADPKSKLHEKAKWVRDLLAGR
jgi:hypothetical protein